MTLDLDFDFDFDIDQTWNGFLSQSKDLELFFFKEEMRMYQKLSPGGAGL